MKKITKTFTKSDSTYGREFSSDAYSLDGGLTWQWISNDSFIMLDTCKEYGIPCDVKKQEAARSAQNEIFFKEYRERMKNHVPDAEEQYEMEAAFGKNVEVVNVITGKHYRT